MKRWIIVVVMMTGLVIACGPVSIPGLGGEAQSVTDGETQPEPAATPVEAGSNSPVATPADTVAFNSPNSPVATPSSNTAAAVDLAWDKNPEIRLISATFCCGYTTPLVPLNYIPDATVWGDGRIIWVEQIGNGPARQVWQGQLSEEQIQTLLQQIADAGFFGWEDAYVDPTISDAAEQCLAVQLQVQSKQVCEYFKGAPPAFHELYDLLAGGAGATRTEYLPTSGYLTAHSLDLGSQQPPAEVQWPADTLGFSLIQATGGVWVEGDVLKQTWEIVNANPTGAVVQDGDSYYQLSLQIPGLSFTEPPPR